MAEYKVIIHIVEQEKWAEGLANATNLLNDLGDEVADVILLANGAAVHMYEAGENDETIDKMQKLTEKGVHFLACQNALRENQLSKGGLHDFVDIVPAGISELVRRQQEGYVYIKP